MIKIYESCYAVIFGHEDREEIQELKELAEKEVLIASSRKNPISEAKKLVPERTIFLKQKH